MCKGRKDIIFSTVNASFFQQNLKFSDPLNLGAGNQCLVLRTNHIFLQKWLWPFIFLLHFSNQYKMYGKLQMANGKMYLYLVVRKVASSQG